MLRSEMFAVVYDYLVKEKKVNDQKDLSIKTGITQTTISRIMKGKVQPNDDTLRKLNVAFGNIFNMQYFRGQSANMLMEDETYCQTHPIERPLLCRPEEKKVENMTAGPSPTPFIPSWADAFFDIMTQQIKQNEALNRELHQSIAEVNALKSDLANLLKKLKK